MSSNFLFYWPLECTCIHGVVGALQDNDDDDDDDDDYG